VGAFNCGGLFFVVCRGFLCVFFLWVFLDLACIYTEFFVGVLVVGVLVFLFMVVCGVLFLLWGFFNPN
jgi:hypothetical protein